MSDSEETTPPLPSQQSVVMQAAPLIQGITPPKPLDTTTNITENWKQFKQIWENYAIITNLTVQTEQYRVALFLHCLGPDAMKSTMECSSPMRRTAAPYPKLLRNLMSSLSERSTRPMNATSLTGEIRAKTNPSMNTLLRYDL